MNTYEFVNIAAQIFPEREALVFEDQRDDYATLQQRIVSLAAGLRERGLGPGRRLGVMDTNSSRFIQLFYATSFLGATFVPLNYRAKREELEYLLSTAEVNFLCAGAPYVDLARAARSAAPSVEELISIDGPAEGMRSFDELLLQDAEIEPTEVDDGDLNVIMFTAGTTSRPKG
ncbi:MAG: long-chain fatty acid--CoA ligase, partial [Chloroflexota bacterium]